MRTLVIPDVHLKWEKADHIINAVPAIDRVVFLGDIFDARDSTPGMVMDTAKWLRHVLGRNDTQIVFSNHDMPYWRPDLGFLWCPGFKVDHYRIINEYIPRAMWEEKWNLVWFEQGWTLSHAGFNKHALPIYPDTDGVIDQTYIARACDEALDRLPQFRNHPLFHQGTRMGSIHAGGCTWLHWEDFEPIGHLNQIVGHTNGRLPRCMHLLDNGKIVYREMDAVNAISKNYCLDTYLDYYGIIEDGKFTIYKTDTHEVSMPNTRVEIVNLAKPNYLDLVSENESIDII